MSQEDPAAKKTLQVKGAVNAERLRAVLEKAGPHGYQFGISIAPDPGADPEAETDKDAEAPGHEAGEQGP